ncbi:MAG TPA: hypothetical protein VNA25_10180 [Phycisphaerae bacterium]|nr:hypothetical protein [Phycisphaerae bacterium]
MSEGDCRSKLGAFVTFPAALGLLLMFFMPWVSLQCDPGSKLLQSPGLKVDTPQGPMPMAIGGNMPDGPVKLLEASGWQLARGKVTPVTESQCTRQQAQDGEMAPKKRSWMYALLMLPALMLLVSAAALAGKISPGGAGKGMLFVGVMGVILTLCASGINYADDIFDADKLAACSGAKPCPRALADVKDKFSAVVKTKATPYLWGSLGLYGLVSLCGVATLLAPPKSLQETVHFRHEESMLGRWGSPVPPMPPPPADPNIPPIQPDEAMDFGPDIGASEPHESRV